MDTLFELFNQSGFAQIDWSHLVMFTISGILFYLAITKEFEPFLLIPIGFGILIAYLPLDEMS